MRALLATVAAALVGVAVLAAPAGAVKYDKYIKVTPLLNRVDVCRASDDLAQWSYTLKARLERRNVKRPSSIRMRYEVTDLDTGAVVRLQVFRLMPKKYYEIGAPTQYGIGHHLQFQLDTSFKSPINGKRRRSRSISNIAVPTAAQIDAANSAAASTPGQSPPYPACG